MARRMRYTMVVRHPETLAAVPLVGGAEVPGWASCLVDDADTTTEGETPTEDDVKVEDATAPTPTGSDADTTTEGETPTEDDEPSESWTNARLRQYADDRGVDLQGATTKSAILEALGA